MFVVWIWCVVVCVVLCVLFLWVGWVSCWGFLFVLCMVLLLVWCSCRWWGNCCSFVWIMFLIWVWVLVLWRCCVWLVCCWCFGGLVWFVWVVGLCWLGSVFFGVFSVLLGWGFCGFCWCWLVVFIVNRCVVYVGFYFCSCWVLCCCWIGCCWMMCVCWDFCRFVGLLGVYWDWMGLVGICVCCFCGLVCCWMCWWFWVSGVCWLVVGMWVLVFMCIFVCWCVYWVVMWYVRIGWNVLVGVGLGNILFWLCLCFLGLYMFVGILILVVFGRCVWLVCWDLFFVVWDWGCRFGWDWFVWCVWVC